MRKSIFPVFCAAALMCGCGGQEAAELCTLTAVVDAASAVTRVEMDASQGLYAWQAGDTLAVCSSARGAGKFVPFAIVGGGRSAEAQFRGALSDTSVKDCAVYPYISGNEPFFKDKDLYFNQPRTSQRWEGAVVAPMLAPASGLESDGKLHFSHLGGVLCVRIEKIPAGTSEVNLIAGSQVSGAMRVDRSVPCLVPGANPGDEERQISLTMAPLAAAQAYFIFNFPLPAGSYPRIRIQARGADGEVLGSYMNESAFTLTRGEIRHLTPVADALPRFAGPSTIKVAAAGVQDATYPISIANNDTYGWTLSLESFGGCVSAASLSGTTLTYSVPANPAPDVLKTGEIVLRLSDPTGGEPSMTRKYIITQGNKAERYFTKVTSAKDDWSGQYLLVYESEYEAYVMYTDDNYSDGSCGGFLVPLEPEGIAYDSEVEAGILTVRKHAPDASGAVHSTAVAGKYTMFIQGSTGIGRYAGDSFGFNNNTSYGRFVETFGYDSDAACCTVSCTTKNSGEAYLKYDSAFQIFGFGLPSEMKEEGRYLDIQLYELR